MNSFSLFSLTLSLIQFSWSITNVEDDLPLGFKWFAWYGGDFISARETIPIYGSERGSQQYVLEVLDAVGDGLCCDHGTGSYALYLGYPSNQSRITHGGKFLVEDFYAFEIDSSGQFLTTPKPVIKPTPPPTKLPTPNPTTPQVLNPNPAPTTQGSTTLEFYAVPSTGLCAVNDSNKPSWINKVYTDYDLCCQESAWNKQACFSSKPAEANITPSNKPTMAQETGNLIEFTPVTGTFTCEKPGLTCTITCSRCGSIERDANGMLMQFPNKSTIVYVSPYHFTICIEEECTYSFRVFVAVQLMINWFSLVSFHSRSTCWLSLFLVCGYFRLPLVACPILPMTPRS